MRLVSGSGSGVHSPVSRSWSSSRIARLAEDEQRARAERDKRRKASIMLGGEEEQQEQEETHADERDRKQAKAGEPAKIKLGDFVKAESAVPVSSKVVVPENLS